MALGDLAKTSYRGFSSGHAPGVVHPHGNAILDPIPNVSNLIRPGLNLSIRGRLILLALVVLAPAVLLAGLLVFEAHRNERAVMERQLSETARALSLVVDRQLGQSDAVLRALATSPALRSGDLGAFYDQAKAAVPGDGHWVVLVGRDGRQLLSTAAPSGAVLPPVQLLDGYERVLSAGDTYVSDLVSNTAGEGQVLAVAIPVARDDTIVDALMLVMQPSSLSGILADQNLPETWVAAIIDRQGTIVARSRRAEEFVGGKATADIRALIQEVERGVVESVTLDGMSTLAAFSRSPHFGWTVIIGAPKAEVFASAWRLLFIVCIVALLIIGVGAVAYARVARGLVQAVEALAAAAGALGRGRSPDVAPSGIPEIDQVGHAMREAADELKAREEELRGLNDSLEQRVSLRTAELEATNRELQSFTYAASHDLKEPLRKIHSFADIMLEDYGPIVGETGRSYLERIQVTALRMSTLLHSLIAYSRVTPRPKDFTRVDLNTVVDGVLRDLQVRIEETEARVEVGPLPEIDAIPSEMQQLLQNLIGNALKFHRPGLPPVVEVRATMESCDGSGEAVCRLEVRDEGIGLSEQYTDRIFEPFQRLHARDQYEGSGIGLAICRRIVERHGGTIAASGAPGVGSSFVVRLPVRQERVAVS